MKANVKEKDWEKHMVTARCGARTMWHKCPRAEWPLQAPRAYAQSCWHEEGGEEERLRQLAVAGVSAHESWVRRQGWVVQNGACGAFC